MKTEECKLVEADANRRCTLNQSSSSFERTQQEPLAGRRQHSFTAIIMKLWIDSENECDRGKRSSSEGMSIKDELLIHKGEPHEVGEFLTCFIKICSPKRFKSRLLHHLELMVQGIRLLQTPPATESMKTHNSLIDLYAGT